MKAQLHTIPVAEAFDAGDECPFCHLQRQTEQRAIRYFAGPGASYMEPEVRGITNRTGFCACHMKKLYDYGNPLGNALMLQTHLEDVMEELHRQAEHPDAPAKKSLFSRKKPDAGKPYHQHLQERVAACAVCDQVESNMDRQYRVFFSLLDEAEFRDMIENSKGFCLPHFARLLQEAEQHLPKAHAAWFYATVYRLMEQHLQRVKQDLDGLIDKYDYRNSGTDWGTCRDALPRTVQKLAGIYPADPPFRKD